MRIQSPAWPPARKTRRRRRAISDVASASARALPSRSARPLVQERRTALEAQEPRTLVNPTQCGPVRAGAGGCAVPTSSMSSITDTGGRSGCFTSGSVTPKPRRLPRELPSVPRFGILASTPFRHSRCPVGIISTLIHRDFSTGPAEAARARKAGQYSHIPLVDLGVRLEHLRCSARRRTHVQEMAPSADCT